MNILLGYRLSAFLLVQGLQPSFFVLQKNLLLFKLFVLFDQNHALILIFRHIDFIFSYRQLVFEIFKTMVDRLLLLTWGKELPNLLFPFQDLLAFHTLSYPLLLNHLLFDKEHILNKLVIIDRDFPVLQYAVELVLVALVQNIIDDTLFDGFLVYNELRFNVVEFTLLISFDLP